MKKILIILAITVTFLGVSDGAFAVVPTGFNVYTTYGEFDTVVDTFQRIGLMMSDSRYQGLFFGIIVLSIVFGCINAALRAIAGNGISTANWMGIFGTIILGVILYKTFIQPTSEITIYDEVMNQQITVGGVPEGLIVIACLSNKIEKGLVDVIWTSGDIESFRDSAGGTVFDMIKSAFSGGGEVNLAGTPDPGAYTYLNLNRYTKDCVVFELSRPGSTININDFYTTTDFTSLLANAANPAIFTVWKDDANKAGITVDCQQCWVSLNNYFSTLTPTSDVVTRFYKEKSGKCGLANVLGAVGPDMADQYRDKVTTAVSHLIGSAVTSEQIVIQALIARGMFDAVQSGDYQVLADRQAGVSLGGMQSMANSWIPVIRAMVFAAFIGLFPFLALLIPTPLCGRIVGFIFGMFVFITSWGICDALIHSFAMHKSVALFHEIAQGKLGLRSLLMFEDEATKALAIFGSARWAGMMIAGVLSSMLAHFGGTAMAHFADQLSASRSYGAGAALQTENPERRAAALQQLTRAVPVLAVANSYGYGNMANQEMYQLGTAMQTSQGIVDHLGSGNPLQAAGRSAAGNVLGEQTRVGTAEKKVEHFGHPDTAANAEAAAIAYGVTAAAAAMTTKTQELGGGNPTAAAMREGQGQAYQTVRGTTAAEQSIQTLGAGDLSAAVKNEVGPEVYGKQKALETMNQETSLFGSGDPGTAAGRLAEANATQTARMVTESETMGGPSRSAMLGELQGARNNAQIDNLTPGEAGVLTEKEIAQQKGDLAGVGSVENAGYSAMTSAQQRVADATMRAAVNRSLLGLPLTPKQQRRFGELMQTETGRRAVEIASMNQSIASLTESQANAINQQLGSHEVQVNPGDAVSFNAGYENGRLSLNNIRSSNLTSRTTGQESITHANRWRYDGGVDTHLNPVQTETYNQLIEKAGKSPEEAIHTVAKTKGAMDVGRNVVPGPLGGALGFFTGDGLSNILGWGNKEARGDKLIELTDPQTRETISKDNPYYHPGRK